MIPDINVLYVCGVHNEKLGEVRWNILKTFALCQYRWRAQERSMRMDADTWRIIVEKS